MKKVLIWLILFSIAMGFLETSVVVYLRELYYPQGFRFPLTVIDNRIAITEFLREAATIIMLIGAGIMAGKTALSRFACFIIAFAVWDLFYYVFLYALLGWPQSLFTWDILFLIPVPWVGPVLAPCIVAFEMFLFGLLIVMLEEKHGKVKLSASHWFLLISGVLVIIMSFISDYTDQVSASGQNSWNLFSQQQLFAEIKTYVPQYYNWWLFWLGNTLCAAGVFLFYKNQSINQTSIYHEKK